MSISPGSYFALAERFKSTPTGSAFANLRPGDHLCSFHAGRLEHLKVSVEFINEGLGRNDTVMVVTAERTRDEVINSLNAAGTDCRKAMEEGRLRFISKWEWRNAGKFERKEMEASVRKLVQTALAGRAHKLWVTVDMSWSLEPVISAEELAKWEAGWNLILRDMPVVLLCQYDSTRIPSDALKLQLSTHPTLILDGNVSANLFFEAPEVFFDNGSGAPWVDWKLDQLRQAVRASDAQQSDESNVSAVADAEMGRERLLDVISAMSDGFIATDGDFRVVLSNPQAARFFGAVPDQLVGRNLRDLCAETENSDLSSSLDQALGLQSTWRSEIRLAPLGIWVDAHVFTYASGIALYMKDITVQRKDRTVLEERERQQRAIAELGRFALSTSDTYALYDRVAWTLASVLGTEFVSIDEFMPGGRELILRAGAGWKSGYVDHSSISAEAGTLACRAIGEGGSAAARGDEGRLLLADNRFVEHGISSGAVCTIPGSEGPWGVLGVYATTDKDLTPDMVDFIRTVADLLGNSIQRYLAEMALREADKRKDDFLAVLSHELRNPLAPIRSSTEVMKLVHELDPRLDRARNVIDRQLGHLTRLVDDLLDVARITRGQVALKKEMIELAWVVRRAVEEVQPLADAQQHALTVTMPLEPVYVEADGPRLVQVFSNLLENAVKYTPNGGQISLSVETADGFAVTRVRDTGVGIPSELLPNVFDLFVQGYQSLDRPQGGLGLGLTLVRHLVERHGGTVEVISEGVGRGCEFTVRLPVFARVVQPAPSDRPPRVRSRSRQDLHLLDGVRVLVVDDSQDLTRTFEVLFEASGAEVKLANDGPTALEVAREFLPHVVFLDIGLPGMDGYEVASKIRLIPELRQIKVVAVTGYGQPKDRAKSRQAGFDEHLVKPVTWPALLSVIRPPSQDGSLSGRDRVNA